MKFRKYRIKQRGNKYYPQKRVMGFLWWYNLGWVVEEANYSLERARNTVEKYKATTKVIYHDAR